MNVSVWELSKCSFKSAGQQEEKGGRKPTSSHTYTHTHRNKGSIVCVSYFFVVRLQRSDVETTGCSDTCGQLKKLTTGDKRSLNKSPKNKHTNNTPGNMIINGQTADSSCCHQPATSLPDCLLKQKSGDGSETSAASQSKYDGTNSSYRQRNVFSQRARERHFNPQLVAPEVTETLTLSPW